MRRHPLRRPTVQHINEIVTVGNDLGSAWASVISRAAQSEIERSRNVATRSWDHMKQVGTLAGA
jgi:hypothetical protein